MSTKGTALVPTTLTEAQQLAAVYAKSSLLPPDLRGKEPDVFVTIMAGHELGMAPMAALRSIHVVKGKPILSADAMVGVVLASGAAEYFQQVESTDKIATYETKRRGAPAPVRLSFTMEEAKLAKLNGGDNWTKYPAAMLRARAKAALARDVYPDALAGVYTEDEARDFRDVSPPPASSSFRAPPPGVPAAAVIDAEIVDERPAPPSVDKGKVLFEQIAMAPDLNELAAIGARVKAAKLPDGQLAELKALYATRKRQLTQAAAQHQADAEATGDGPSPEEMTA